MKLKNTLLKSILLVVVITMFMFIPNTVQVKAATKPTLNSSSEYITIGKTYNLKVNNKIKGSKYTWTSSNKKVVTVNKAGVVKGISGGEAKITCKITANKKTYTLSCYFNVIDKNTIYTITETTKPSASIQKKGHYNSNTKDWYLFNEILGLCEKGGGGKIIIEKGTYSITNKVSIPSNVTILLKDGAVIKKSSETGTTSLKATKTMFQLVEPSKASKTGVYTQYNGVHDVSIIGEGTATIDLDYMDGACGFVMGHNQNVSFDNISFINMNTGHFIELDASKDVTIQNCRFLGSKKSPKTNKEAINIDTPDKLTGGFSHEWSSLDKTPVKNISITDCIFEEIDVAIGTHKYSQIQDEKGDYSITMFHEDIQVKKCQFINLRAAGLQMIAWKNVTVEDCVFEGGGYILVNPTTGQEIPAGARAFSGQAVINFTFKNNIIKDMFTVGGAYSSTGTGLGTASNIYTSITSYITVDNIKDFYTNKCSNVEMPIIFLNYNTFEVSDENKEQITIKRPGEPDKYQLNATIPSV